MRLRRQMARTQWTSLYRKVAAAVHQMKKQQASTLNRRVVKKMLVTFVARPSQRHDVLELMSRVLGFTEDEMEVVGLTNKGLLPPTPSKRLKEAASKPLAELWVNYLMEEAGSAPPSSSPSAAPATSATQQKQQRTGRKSFAAPEPQYA